MKGYSSCQCAKRRICQIILVLISLLLFGFISYFLWSPGCVIKDGRHNLRRNGIWLQHGWLGDDDWFQRYRKMDKIEKFRNVENIRDMALLLRSHDITEVYPHLCPTSITGHIPNVDSEQAKRFLREFRGFRVMPWVGGVWGKQVFPNDANWRANFIQSIVALMETYNDLAGIHINIEPCPSGNLAFINLLHELRQALPKGKMISVAAYPPPTLWHPYPEVHWEEAYFRKVARQSDQIVVMMYDTALNNPKLYRHLMASWTSEVLNWSEDASVMLGLPAYDDAGVGYHNPKVENLPNALSGIHAGLSRYKKLPHNYQGIAIYCEWEMDKAEWDYLKEHF